MKSPNPLEKEIEKKVCAYAASLGILVYKFTSISRRSVPDRLFILPGGKGVFFIEFKRKGQKPTAAQEVEIEKIRKQGTRVYVIDEVAEGMRAINNETKIAHWGEYICCKCGLRQHAQPDQSWRNDPFFQ